MEVDKPEDCVSTISLIINSKESVVPEKIEENNNDVPDVQETKTVKKPKKQRRKKQKRSKKIINEIHEIIQRDIEELRADLMTDAKNTRSSLDNIHPRKKCSTKSIKTKHSTTSSLQKNKSEYWANQQYFKTKYCGAEGSLEILSKSDKALNDECKQIIPDVYRKPAFTDLYEKLLMQLEMNDSFVCFQKLMAPPRQSKSHRQIYPRINKDSKISLFGELKRKYSNSLWFSSKYLIKQCNVGGNKKMKRKSSSDMKKIKSSSKASISDVLRKGNNSHKSSVISLTNRSSSSRLSNKKNRKYQLRKNRNSSDTIQKKQEVARNGKYFTVNLVYTQSSLFAVLVFAIRGPKNCEHSVFTSEKFCIRLSQTNRTFCIVVIICIYLLK